MAEDKLKELNDRVDKVVSDIYNYIKCVDEKVVQSDKTVKFISSQQSEQMKELIAAKTDNLRRFFEEAIRLQTEVVRNTYETMISELKLTYMEDLKNKDAEYYKLYNQKEETLKASFEADCQKRLNECYAAAKADFDKVLTETVSKYESEKIALQEKFSTERQTDKQSFEAERQALLAERQKVADEVYQNTKTEYEAEMARRSEEAYNNGKAETEAWHDDIVRKKLEIQAQYFDGEIEKAKADAYAAGESHMKKEMYDEMDEAARRNEAELKLFLDFYEAKMKPFKRFINIHETADKRIKDIQRRITNKINKTILHKPTIPPPADEFPKDIERTVQQATFDAPLSEDGDK